MGKTLNPADAYRKSLRKKELKKARNNTTQRSKAREFTLVKKDTRELEDEIEQLEGLAQPSASDKARLSAAKSELDNIVAKKEAYVKEHPEHRRLVFRARKDKDMTEEIILPKKRNYFDKNGLPRHPERSIYYDKIMNPYGVAPPGMPYIERPLLPGEIDSEGEDDDDEITMPHGAPPQMDEPVSSDDDIPMPDDVGTSGDDDAGDPSQPPLPPGLPPILSGINPPLPSGPPPLPIGIPFPPLLAAGMIPLPPAGFTYGNVPVPPTGFPLPMGYPSLNLPPPPPPGFFSRREKSASAMQDPLSSIPHQTFQAHRASRITAHPSLPAKPAAGTPSSVVTNATVSAEPQLRDFKKEATAFVPTALKRKRGGASAASSRVNAAPGVDNDDGDDDSPAAAPRPDLLSTIAGQFGPVPPVAKQEQNAVIKTKSEVPKKQDDYERFVEDIGDILNP
ncbi:hypothetical protein D9757_002316 [Collybiopsis confluens]|uniref:Wbp11/ELF5/Saf1 N-terminal domain-containing protein n=1 Tax=Collybiopsis confluens TaxID=2823264 RepID=A0A8H5I031_9AGAR|nr:hypothetical protein D9757_002316 [Collybiopsis confluens]